MRRFHRLLDCVLATTLSLAKWLAFPVVALLFLQWPLRDGLHCCSREANDIGQIAFALFVAVSVTAATRAGTHLRADALAAHYSDTTRRRIRQAANVFVLLPWSALVLVHLSPAGWQALLSLERFADTGNPGYFLIRLAALLLALLVFLQALMDFFGRQDHPAPQEPHAAAPAQEPLA